MGWFIKFNLSKRNYGTLGISEILGLFYSTFGRWGGDGNGQGVHVWANCENANASYSHDWLWQYDEFKIGTGQDNIQGSYATLDVIGHEFTHAVTHHTAGLNYEKELNLWDSKEVAIINSEFEGIKGENIKMIELNSSPSGVYFIELQNGSKSSTQKIVKTQ